MKTFLFDASLCNGCYCCQIACKDEHVANDWTPYAKPQPDIGQFWLKLVEKELGSYPKVRVAYKPILCMHCDNPPCIASCPADAIYKRDDGLVVINSEKCTGCRKCVDDCPYGAIYYNESMMLAQKCTGCAHLIDRGWKEPRCVDACPTMALRFGEEEELRELARDAEVLLADAGYEPRVRYKNVLKSFIAGAVYDEQKDECLEGAQVKIANLGTGAEYGAITDVFGDFWFNLEPGKYSLVISLEGYAPYSVDSVDAVQAVNLGDIPLVPGA